MRDLLIAAAFAALCVGCERKDSRASALAAPGNGAANADPQGDGGGVGGVVRQGGGGAGGSVFNRVSREKSLMTLAQLYKAYLATIASNGKPPRDAEDLKAGDESVAKLLKSPRDGKPFEIAFGVDPATVQTAPSETLLVWEATADSDGNRCALTVSGTPVYLTEEEFKKKTKPKN